MIRVAHSSSAAKTWFPCRTVFSSAPCRASLAGMLFLLVIVMVSVTVHGEDLPCYTLDPVVVTGSRIPRHLSGTGQSISIITREDIADAPADNIYDLLETVNGLDIRRRGGPGVQADAFIRGGSFEQTLILVDGVNVSDPQTGHHNLDVPVNLEDIERIEILKGPGARVYGQNAMAGVINIITLGAHGNSLGGHGRYGEHDYYDVGAHGSLAAGRVSNRVSGALRRSTGHIEDEDTDFDIKTFTYNGAVGTGEQSLRLGIGYTDKDFGAYRFYSDTFPNQREATEALLVYTKGHFRKGDLEVMHDLFWRRHNDDFELELEDGLLRNRHRTDSYGTHLHARFKSNWGTTAVGGEAAFESLQSTNLGNHDRKRGGIFLEHRLCQPPGVTLNLGLAATHYSRWGWEPWPGAELSVKLGEGVTWFASSGRSFRVPTFTELYYDTPANQGNPDLKPEKAWSHETGLRWFGRGCAASAGIFLRDEEDIIDWTRASDQEPWTARNVAESTTLGIEAALSLYPEVVLNTGFVDSVNLAYTYLDSHRDSTGLESKYVLDRLRHQLNGSIVFDWGDHLRHTLKARYQERMLGHSELVVDTRLAYKWGRAVVFVEAANVFDEKYVDGGFAPMPGRWILGGIQFLVDFTERD